MLAKPVHQGDKANNIGRIWFSYGNQQDQTTDAVGCRDIACQLQFDRNSGATRSAENGADAPQDG